jgi:protein-L-isoaspartate(D-aspartate) O-methyltransferase
VVDGSFDAILVNAGVTHPLDAWLDALADGGRMIVPLTSTMAPMGSTIGKGLVVVLTKQSAAEFSARVLTVVAVYSAVGLRDESMNERLGKAMMGGPMKWAAVKRLRRDPHDETPACWLHKPGCCVSTA